MKTLAGTTAELDFTSGKSSGKPIKKLFVFPCQTRIFYFSWKEKKNSSFAKKTKTTIIFLLVFPESS